MSTSSQTARIFNVLASVAVIRAWSACDTSNTGLWQQIEVNSPALLGGNVGGVDQADHVASQIAVRLRRTAVGHAADEVLQHVTVALRPVFVRLRRTPA